MAEHIQHILYADCFSGISGDMFLAALIDAGLPEEHLSEQLSGIEIADFKIDTSTTLEQGRIKAVKLSIKSSANTQPHCSWSVIRGRIQESNPDMD